MLTTRSQEELQAYADAARLATHDVAHEPALVARRHALADWPEDPGWEYGERPVERSSAPVLASLCFAGHQLLLRTASQWVFTSWIMRRRSCPCCPAPRRC
jgi:hypothetical protein